MFGSCRGSAAPVLISSISPLGDTLICCCILKIDG
jgi:hypothetical protein